MVKVLELLTFSSNNKIYTFIYTFIYKLNIGEIFLNPMYKERNFSIHIIFFNHILLLIFSNKYNFHKLQTTWIHV